MVNIEDIIYVRNDGSDRDWKYYVCWKEGKHPAHNGYFVSLFRATEWMYENKEYLIAEWERSLENILLIT